MPSTVGIPSITDDTDIVASSDEDILSLYWNKATGELKGKTGVAGEILEFSAGTRVVLESKVLIPSVEVLQLFTTPKQLVAAPGVGLAIEIISSSIECVFNTISYATNVSFILITNNANTQQFSDDRILSSTIARITESSKTGAPFTVSDTQIIENEALTASVLIGNPTGGDSDINVYVSYRILTV